MMPEVVMTGGDFVGCRGKDRSKKADPSLKRYESYLVARSHEYFSVGRPPERKLRWFRAYVLSRLNNFTV